jgi:hypothetical protein
MRLSEYSGYLKKYGPIYTIKEIYYRFLHNILGDILFERRDKDTIRLLKRYLKADTKGLPLQPIKKPCIWTCWFQGIDNAPPIVKACIESMHRHSGNYEIVVITEKNMKDYANFPDYITQKFYSGIIPVAHFSDLLRTLLLVNHGGIWIDATVFLTQNIPPFLINSDFFVFQRSLLNPGLQPCSSWLIISKKDNLLLKKVITVLFNYWKINNYLIHYFIYHLTFFLLIHEDTEIKRFWENIFYKNNSDPHFLQSRLFDEYEPMMKNYIWDLSFAHKLTYKFPNADLVKRENTYYKYIINGIDFIKK